jgi:hypothetical protein
VIGVASYDKPGEDFLLSKSWLEAAIPQRSCTVRRDFSSGKAL